MVDISVAEEAMNGKYITKVIEPVSRVPSLKRVLNISDTHIPYEYTELLNDVIDEY